MAQNNPYADLAYPAPSKDNPYADLAYPAQPKNNPYADLAYPAATNTNPFPQHPFLSAIDAGLRSVPAGIVKGAADLGNMLLPQSIQFHGNVDKAYGLGPQNQNWGTNVIKGTAEALPATLLGQEAAIGGLGKLGMNVARGSLTPTVLSNAFSGAVTSPGHRARGALVGGGSAGVMSAAVPLAGKAIGGLGQGLLNFTKQKIAPELEEVTGNMLRKGTDTIKKNVFDMAQDQYNSARKNVNNLWDNAEKLAQSKGGAGNLMAPGEVTRKISQPWKGLLTRTKNIVIDQTGGQIPTEGENSLILNKINELQNSPINNWADVMKHGHAVNSVYSDLKTAQPDYNFKVIKDLAQQYKDIARKGIANAGHNDLLNAWDNANQATRNMHYNYTFDQNDNLSPFMKTLQAQKGFDSLSKAAGDQSVPLNKTDYDQFASKYKPSESKDVTAKVNSVTNMLGGTPMANQHAKDFVRALYLENAYKDEGGANASKALTKLGNLSPQDQNTLFTPQQQNYIRAWNIANKAKPLDNSKGITNRFYNAITGGLGDTQRMRTLLARKPGSGLTGIGSLLKPGQLTHEQYAEKVVPSLLARDQIPQRGMMLGKRLPLSPIVGQEMINKWLWPGEGNNGT